MLGSLFWDTTEKKKADKIPVQKELMLLIFKGNAPVEMFPRKFLIAPCG